MSEPDLCSLLWSVANLLRGDFKQSEYGKRPRKVSTKIGHEILIHRHFYVRKPPCPLAVIDAEQEVVTDRIVERIRGLSQ